VIWGMTAAAWWFPAPEPRIDSARVQEPALARVVLAVRTGIGPRAVQPRLPAHLPLAAKGAVDLGDRMGRMLARCAAGPVLPSSVPDIPGVTSARVAEGRFFSRASGRICGVRARQPDGAIG